jgi:hypothetical protein
MVNMKKLPEWEGIQVQAGEPLVLFLLGAADSRAGYYLS